MITVFPTGEYYVECLCPNCGRKAFWRQLGKPSKADLLRHHFCKDEDICLVCHILKEIEQEKREVMKDIVMV